MKAYGSENSPLSYSSLKEFVKSPRHFVYYKEQPRKPPTDAMLLGTCVDILLLTPEDFAGKIMPVHNINRRTTDGKNEHAAMVSLAQAQKMTLVSNDIINQATEIVAYVKTNSKAMEMVNARKGAQVKLFWTDKKYQLSVVGYVDLETAYKGKHCIVDIKTAASADPEEFSRQAGKLMYDLQMGAYLEGYRRTRYMFPDWYWMIIETTEPYAVEIIKAEAKEMEAARAFFQDTLKAFKICQEHECWEMGYEFRHYISQLDHTFSIPGYIKRPYKNWGIEI